MAGRHAPARHRGPRHGADRPVAGGILRPGPRGGPAHLSVPVLRTRAARRQRLRPPGRGRHRLRRHGPRRRARSHRHRCRPPTARERQLLPRGRGAAPPGPAASRDHPARGTELSRWTATSSAGRSGRCVSPWTRSRASSCTRWGTRTAVGCDPCCSAASVSEMVVPYGDPGPMHGWKNAFDAGEWGLGRMANSLTLGCDCLGVIHYFDTVFATEGGLPYVAKNVICMHEEDYGILWKHYDARSDRSEVRRSRRLVVSSIATVGNYDYGFFWYFYLDGTIQFEAKLTGILSTMAVAPARAAGLRLHGGATAGRPLPPAPVQRPAGRGCRRAHELRLRGRHPPGRPRVRTTRGRMRSRPRRPCCPPSWTRAAW